MQKYYKLKDQRFLSTPSARRATCCGHSFHPSPSISIHALREEGDWLYFQLQFLIFISIHALREEGDILRSSIWIALANFYPRPPRGGRPLWHIKPQWRLHFYPRPPRGGRPQKQQQNEHFKRFLSTPSARRATQCCHSNLHGTKFLSTPSARRATIRFGT